MKQFSDFDVSKISVSFIQPIPEVCYAVTHTVRRTARKLILEEIIWVIMRTII